MSLSSPHNSPTKRHKNSSPQIIIKTNRPVYTPRHRPTISIYNHSKQHSLRRISRLGFLWIFEIKSLSLYFRSRRSMSTSSSSSSREGARRSVYGVPTKCWCGKGLVIWASETKENPFRRFYRCQVALQRKSESHLFKWEDEAILDEVRIVDAKVMNLVQDFKSLSKSVIQQLDSQQKLLLAFEAEMRSTLHEHSSQIQHAREATNQIKEEIDATLSSMVVTTQLNDNGPAHNFAAAVAIVGAIACLYWKFL